MLVERVHKNLCEMCAECFEACPQIAVHIYIVRALTEQASCPASEMRIVQGGFPS